MTFARNRVNFLIKSCLISSRRLCSTRPKKKLPDTVEIYSQRYKTDDWTNVTPKIVSLIGRNLYKTEPNPLYLISQGIRQHFNQFDYFEYESPVVDLEANFDSLLIAKDHVSRDKADTYYVNRELLLRSHTSAHQAHCLKQGSSQFVCIADVYRRDAIDATHFPAFHQCEVMQLFSKQDVSY